MNRSKGIQGPRRRSSLAAVLVVGAVVSVGGCDGLLDVELPGDMTEGDLFQPSSAAMIVNSAVGDYECAFSMSSVLTAGMEDTWWRTTGYWGDWAEYRATRPPVGACGTTDFGTGWYAAFQSGRWMAEQAYEHLSEWTVSEVPDRSRLMAISATYAGLAYQYFGENFCETTANVGPLMSQTQTLREGEVWFGRALEIMGSSGDYSYVTTTSLRQLAYLGRARVRLALGDHAGAASDAAQVQPGFVAYATRDSGVQPRWNHVVRGLNVMLMGSIAGPVQWQGQTVSVGYRNLTIAPDGRHTVGEGVADPRVPVMYTGEFAADGVTDMYMQQKYLSLGDDQIMAKWAEAQLILAEIEGGQQAVARINALRDVHGLPHFSSEDPTAIRNAIIEERRREFFFEGRHFADKLRYGLWLPNGVGSNHKAVAYGNVSCLMMPELEYQNNPNVPEGYLGPY